MNKNIVCAFDTYVAYCNGIANGLGSFFYCANQKNADSGSYSNGDTVAFTLGRLHATERKMVSYKEFSRLYTDLVK